MLVCASYSSSCIELDGRPRRPTCAEPRPVVGRARWGRHVVLVLLGGQQETQLEEVVQSRWCDLVLVLLGGQYETQLEEVIQSRRCGRDTF